MIKKLMIFILTILLLFPNNTRAFASNHTDEFNRLNKYLESSFKKAHIQGASLIVVNKDKILYQNTYGNCKNRKDLFIIGSMSKSFTALSIMQLVEQNKIKLDNPISAYLPDAFDGNKITVRQLLNQTSGISTYATQENYVITKNQGTHVYANANYGILGQIVEKVSGNNYADYVKQNIFIPAGMSHTYTSLTSAKKNGLIDGYRNYFGFTKKEEMPYPDLKSKGWLSVPAGYIISSSLDMGKYLQMYLNDGKNIISKDSIHTMFYDKVKVMKDVDYGMGWGSLSNYSEPVIYHGGLVENYSSAMYLFPQSGTGICLLTNTNDYLVGVKMMDQVFLDTISIHLGEEPNKINGNTYWTKHLWYDALYLLIILVSLLPLIRIKKWKKRWENSKSFLWLLCFIGIHVILPSLIILLPIITGIPKDVVKGFVPDLFLVFVVSVILLYGTGIGKIIIRVKSNGKKI